MQIWVTPEGQGSLTQKGGGLHGSRRCVVPGVPDLTWNPPPPFPCREFLPWALRAGARAPDLMCIYYEKHWAESLEELRLRWRVEVAPAAPQNMQRQRQQAADRAAAAAAAAPGAAAPVAP